MRPLSVPASRPVPVALATPLLLLGALTAIRLAVAAATPLSPDEAYYWLWSRALQPGYLDHPYMVALWIRAGTALAGGGALGVRLLGPLAGALGTLLLVRAAEDLLPGREAGWRAAALLNATLLFGVGTVIMTPDTPLLFFWVVTLWAMGRLLATGRGEWWLAAGLAAGAAMASKYTAALLVGGIFLWALALPQGRAWLRRPHPWVAALLCALVFLPVLLWNAQHGWVSFLKQGGRTGDWHPARAAQFLGELIGGQAGLATPLVFILCVAGVWVACRRTLRGEPGWALLAALTVPGAAVFLEHALGDRVQGNWPAILYPAATIAAAGLSGRWAARLRGPAVALGLAMTALVYLQAATAILPLPPKADITLKELGGWHDLAAQVEAARLRTGAVFVAADDYGVAAELDRDLPPGVPVLGAAPRWRLFDLPHPGAALAGRPGLLVRSAHRSGPPDAAPWGSVRPDGTVSRGRDGVTAEEYRLYRVTGRAGAADAALLPRPSQERADGPAKP